MEIIIDRENVALIDAYNKMGIVEEIITREEFETNFHIDLSETTNVTYSPLRKQFFVTYGEIDVRVFESPASNVILNHIEINKDAIVSYIENKWIEEHKPSQYHIMKEDGKWYISPENQVLLDNENKVIEAISYLKQTDWVIVKITEMQLEGADTTSLMEKYKEELVNRTFYRNLINSLEE